MTKIGIVLLFIISMTIPFFQLISTSGAALMKVIDFLLSNVVYVCAFVERAENLVRKKDAVAGDEHLIEDLESQQQ